MNIFFVHKDPRTSARMLCDKHICKMILESVQMLCTAWSEEEAPKTCGASHVNHPCSRWARETSGNYNWLSEHVLELSKEYTKRYGKVHAWQGAVDWLHDNNPFVVHNKPCRPMTAKPQCMPAYCKVDGDPIQAYRNYYINEKSYMAKWKNSTTPKWYEEALETV